MLRVITSSFVLGSALAAASPTPGSPGVSQLYYQSDSTWSSAYFYYSVDGGANWTTLPGASMSASTNSSFPASKGWYQTDAMYANALTFDLNDGGSNWDNNGGSDYHTAAPGVYALSLSDGLTALQTSDATCSDHGTLDKTTLTCTCEAGYFDAVCAEECACSGAHASCDPLSGACTCAAGWDTCDGGGDQCTTDVSSDPDNCGACGVSCDGPGVATASCADSQCAWTCSAGYTLCPDGCVAGDTCPLPPLPDCQTYSDNQCAGDVITTNASYASHTWQTPTREADFWQPSFQDYAYLAGNTHLVYASDGGSASVEVRVLQQDPSDELTFYFDGVAQSSPNKTYTHKDDGPVSVTVKSSSGYAIDLEPVDFAWAAPAVAERDGDFRSGQKGAIVEFFGWPHGDVEQECQFLADQGYMGAKVFPPQESVMSYQPFNNALNPWYFFYQPASYRLNGRLGTRDELRDMIHTCRQLGVRVYADAVVNHMVGSGNDYNPDHRNDNGGSCDTWPNKTTTAPDALQSPMYTQGFVYEPNANSGLSPQQEFPAVPYSPTDFHCERTLDSWTDPTDLNAGWLTGLTDLNTELDNVQERIADYMTDLLSIGFSGFRIDAAKHIKPDDLVAILAKFKRNMGGALPADFITWLEVLLGGESDLLMTDEDSGYNYGAYLAKALAKAGFSSAEVDQVKIWASGYPKEPSDTIGAIGTVRMAVQNDDADQQSGGSTSRDMADQGSVLVLDHSESGIDAHRGFEVKLFSDPNGATDNDNDYPIRLILSSYYLDGPNTQPEGTDFTGISDYPIPDGRSDIALCTTTCDGVRGMSLVAAYDDKAKGYAGPVYSRVHRDDQIVAAMQEWVHFGGNSTSDE